MRTHIKRIAAAAVAAACTGAALPAGALNLLTEENPPFNYTDGAKVAGVATEVVTEMAKRAGVPITIAVLPWEQAYSRAQGERDTCVYSTARLENRELQFGWVGPIATNKWAIFGREDFKPVIAKVEDLRKFKIGAVTGDAKVEFLRQSGIGSTFSVDVDRNNPERLNFKPDDAQRIDLWITGLYSGKRVAESVGVKGLKVVFVARDEPLWLACSGLTPKKTLQDLSVALDAMKKDGTFGRINGAWEKRLAP